ncbi:MAG: DNA methyltransferase [Ardenticatenaceae bacterium]
MVQLRLFGLDSLERKRSKDLIRESFSHNEVCGQDARLLLEDKYGSLLEETHEFNRRLVSYQGNKKASIHSWIKYREGFSAKLVEKLIDQAEIGPGETILEPFCGSATTLLTAKMLGIDAVGIEILPLCHLMWEAKDHIFKYDLEELQLVKSLVAEIPPGCSAHNFQHLVITKGAFSSQNESDLLFYTEWIETLEVSEPTKTLFRLLLTSILEEISYTRKDGQYLRWDHRSEKVQQRNLTRISQGKKPFKKFNKGNILSVKEALCRALGSVIEDINKLQKRSIPEDSQQTLLKGSALQILPSVEADQFHGVITSPPYCNRYDYTRTYALELAYFGVGEAGIRDLRQSQLSCTVENRSKVSQLEQHYRSLGLQERYNQIIQVSSTNSALGEINQALQQRWARGEINNKGILRMVEGYFTELTFIFAELWRVCRRGAQVAFVNDNVRYGGEVIPVDLLSTDLAAQVGFEPVKVYVLPQRKGNSSQQMGKFGRTALRKSITIWRKP